MSKKTGQMTPLLASEAPKDTKDLKYPLFASPKLDGVRGMVVGRELLSRALKKIPNLFVQKFFQENNFDGLDGELIVGEPNAKDVFNKTTSGVMRIKGEPDFSFYIFDFINTPTVPFKDRFSRLESMTGDPRILVLPQMIINNETELLEYEQKVLELGYEGLILRSIDGRYKYGRSTTKEGIMLKLKRFTDAEAEIIGFEELMHNANEAKTNELGRTDRSSKQENLIPMDTMGALIVRDLETGLKFNIGTGFSDDDRDFFWKNRKKMLGTIQKYKYFKIGVKDLPRHPVWLGERNPIDMS